MRLFAGLSATAATVVLVTAFSASAAAQTPEAQTVVTIHWGSPDFPTTAPLDGAIRDALHAQGRPARYFSEYLDTENLPADQSERALHDYIREKYRDQHIDLVIADATPAVQFALANRDELFGGAPIVFLSGTIPELAAHPPNVTGIIYDAAFADTLELALKVHPGVRQIFVVAQSPKSPNYDERIRTALGRFSSRVQLTYIKEKTVAGLLAAIKNLPTDSLIYYTRYAPDDSDRSPYPDEVVRLMARVSPVPIYGTSDIYIGSGDVGAVGGMVPSTRLLGHRIGVMGRQVLDGTPPSAIPFGAVELEPIFDARQLARWGIDASRVPPNADIQFRTPSPWDTYRIYIISALVVVALQMLLISGLLTQRLLRRRAEKEIEASEARLRASYERVRQLTGRLIKAQETTRADIARELHDGVCQELAAVATGVSALKRVDGDIQAKAPQQAFERLEADARGVFEGIRRVSHDLHPASLRLLGLSAALQAHCREVANRHGVQVTFKTEGEVGPLHEDVAVALFRIAQESMRNAIEHGQARRLAVTLAPGGSVELTIEDDGRGFDVEAARTSGSGLGLVSIEERAHAVGGGVSIFSTVGQGTIVQVHAPAIAARASSVA